VEIITRQHIKTVVLYDTTRYVSRV